MAESPGGKETFNQLISGEGQNIFTEHIDAFGLVSGQDYQVGELKQALMSHEHILLGYIHDCHPVLNPSSSGKLSFDKDDVLVLLGSRNSEVQ